MWPLSWCTTYLVPNQNTYAPVAVWPAFLTTSQSSPSLACGASLYLLSGRWQFCTSHSVVRFLAFYYLRIKQIFTSPGKYHTWFKGHTLFHFAICAAESSRHCPDKHRWLRGVTACCHKGVIFLQLKKKKKIYVEGGFCFFVFLALITPAKLLSTNASQ